VSPCMVKKGANLRYLNFWLLLHANKHIIETIISYRYRKQQGTASTFNPFVR
jgi:hypothetical protein